MVNPESASIQSSEEETNVYSVWALPPEDVSARIENLMNSLRSEFGGPQFEPHITVVGAIRLTAEDALNKFLTACQGIKAYQATVDHVSTGTFFYQCVFLLIHPTTEVLPSHPSALPLRLLAYMPHMSLLYAHISDEKKKQAKEIADKLDEAVNGLKFPITRLALWKTDTSDETLKSWEKIVEHDLSSS
ncbi:cyclic phosphodiesterase-like [Cucumis melo var. makuwa]|uniref:Cyclic phosphodiesterase-like n=1 Tax=Cucumis melo var. makuwa TaxID=1194695 RepID=A0A5D3CNS3_CUCMM|nr:cyclic phosphodiesterase-like [Cucumis melo var. makuwa]TYK13235.1 cyclic phosphodiesterase-like [Cucumis melo var. makuwa]